MYILKNSLRNLSRNRGRNLMVGGIIFVLIVSVVTALMINNTADGVINDYKTRFGSEVSLTINRENMVNQVQGGRSSGASRGAFIRPSIPPEQYLAFGSSDHLLYSVFTAQGRGVSDQIEAVDEALGGGGGPALIGQGPGGNAVEQPQLRQYMFRLLANEYGDFDSGDRELAEGRFPENPGECLISVDLLELNGLSVGDTIRISADISELGSQSGEETYHDIDYVLTVVGAYDDLTDEYGANMRENAYSNRRNEIFMVFDDLAAEVREGWMGISIDAAYYLKDPGLLDAFAAECYAKGLSEAFSVTTDQASYNAIVGPVENMKGICAAFVIIVLAFGAVILALLSSIAIRERKYEIGVLRAMGMKKHKVVFGLWTETLVITAVCLILGLGAGMLAAQPVTDFMLDQQVAAAENAGPNSGGPQPVMIGGGQMLSSFGGPAAEPLQELDVSLGFLTVLEIVGIALILSSLSGIIAARKITKYEPIKILMERN